VSPERLTIGQPYLTLIASWDLGRVQAARGQLRAAAATYRRALEFGAQAGPAVGVAHVGLAEVLCEQDELDAALDQVTEGVKRCRQLAYPLPLSAGLAALARIRQAQGDRAGTLAAIAEAGQVGPSPEVVDLFNPAPVERARLLVADGEVEEGARWRCGARGAWWRTVRSRRPLVGWPRAASARTTRRAMSTSASCWSSRGCCWPNNAPSRRLACSGGSAAWPGGRPAPGARTRAAP